MGQKQSRARQRKMYPARREREAATRNHATPRATMPGYTPATRMLSHTLGTLHSPHMPT